MWVLTTALVPNLLNQIIIGLSLCNAPCLACIHGNSLPGLHEKVYVNGSLLTLWHGCKQGHNINAMMCNVYLCMYHMCKEENLLMC